MTTTPERASRNSTQIEALPDVPAIRITREFDAPVERVFRAWVEPELFVRWVGPRSIDTTIDEWDARTGGSWRYVSARGDEEFAFYGSFHELRPAERIVQTFTFEGMPDAVALEILTLEPLPGGRTRLRALSISSSVEERDAFVASGMEVGVVQGYEQLDELLATMPS